MQAHGLGPILKVIIEGPAQNYRRTQTTENDLQSCTIASRAHAVSSPL